jgi:hypothetical protein
MISCATGHRRQGIAPEQAADRPGQRPRSLRMAHLDWLEAARPWRSDRRKRRGYVGHKPTGYRTSAERVIYGDIKDGVDLRRIETQPACVFCGHGGEVYAPTDTPSLLRLRPDAGVLSGSLALTSLSITCQTSWASRFSFQMP